MAMAGVTEAERELKRFLTTLHVSKQKKEMCIAGIEMRVLKKEDLIHIADKSVTLDSASNYLHKKVMDM